MISASVLKRDTDSSDNTSIIPSLWTNSYFLWLIAPHLDYQTIAVLYTVNKGTADVLFSLNIGKLTRIGSPTNYIDNYSWGKYFIEVGIDKTYTKFAYFSDLEEVYITENVCERNILRYGHKFNKLKTLTVLIESQNSHNGFQYKYIRN